KNASDRVAQQRRLLSQLSINDLTKSTDFFQNTERRNLHHHTHTSHHVYSQLCVRMKTKNNQMCDDLAASSKYLSLIKLGTTAVCKHLTFIPQKGFFFLI
uniref:Uncharacterized protein n=1 Tax=Gasterosteus aculeatus TaxID=69293 RepID=G3P8H7_GASAC